VYKRQGEASADGISRKLGLDPAAVGRHLHLLSQQGMVRIDADQVQMALAA